MTWLITRRDVLAAPYVLLLLTAHMAYCQPIGLRLSAKELFVLAQRADAINDKVNVALIYEALEQDSNRDIRNEARFRYAAFQRRNGSLAAAATLYRRILDEKSDAKAVRLELAAVLAQMGNISAARRELRQAQAGGLPPQVAQVVKQYAAALRSRKPWGGSFELALAPDSNINRATSATTLDTVIAQPVAGCTPAVGLGIKESSQIYGRLDLGKSFTLVPRASSQATLYQTSQFNDISASAQLGLEYRRKADRITPSAGYTWRWYGGNIYARTQSLSLDWLHPAGKRAQIDTAISLNRVRYATNSLQDGMIYTAAVSYERALSARSGASVTRPIARQRAIPAMPRPRAPSVACIGMISARPRCLPRPAAAVWGRRAPVPVPGTTNGLVSARRCRGGVAQGGGGGLLAGGSGCL
jgi:tetratricopeptide (TPR) repeat protein